MNSEAPGGGNQSRIEAIYWYAQGIETMETPVTSLGVKALTKVFLDRTLDLRDDEGLGAIKSLVESGNMPDDEDLWESHQKSFDMLKVGLFDQVIEEYALSYSPEEFRAWIGPFMEFVLEGHTPKLGAPADHNHTCVDEKCPAISIAIWSHANMNRRLGSLDGDEEYLVFSAELVNMHVSLAQTLSRLGVFDEHELEGMLEKYQDWLDSLPGTFPYDKKLFDLAGTGA